MPFGHWKDSLPTLLTMEPLNLEELFMPARLGGRPRSDRYPEYHQPFLNFL